MNKLESYDHHIAHDINRFKKDLEDIELKVNNEILTNFNSVDEDMNIINKNIQDIKENLHNK